MTLTLTAASHPMTTLIRLIPDPRMVARSTRPARRPVIRSLIRLASPALRTQRSLGHLLRLPGSRRSFEGRHPLPWAAGA